MQGEFGADVAPLQDEALCLEVGAFGFISQDGQPSVRLEADTDLFLTQRFILTLGSELDWLLTDDDRLDLDRGIAEVELGLRTRYEIRRKFAPYVDLSWVREKEGLGAGAGSVTNSAVRVGVGLRLVY